MFYIYLFVAIVSIENKEMVVSAAAMPKRLKVK